MRNLLFIIILLGFLGCQSGLPKDELMPNFDILLTDSVTRLNTASIEPGRPIALLYFSPDCEHCQAETKGLIEHMDSLKDVRFIFVTNEAFNEMKIFSQVYKLGNYPNISVGQDDQFFMIRHFKGIFPPYLVAYDQQKRQKAIFDGQAKMSDLVHFFNKL